LCQLYLRKRLANPKSYRFKKDKMIPNPQFEQFLDTFPSSVHERLETMPQNRGRLAPEHCRAVMESLNISVETLMKRLLPLARLYSRTPISGFQVGAVAKAQLLNHADDFALFLGANIEFPAQALTQTIHAEQSAVVNAWLQGADKIEAIAVTAAPCGHCRQFLYELDGSDDLKIILHNQPSGKTSRHRLDDFLPEAFGPRELGQAAGSMAASARPANLALHSPSDDVLVQKALTAAAQSYAPYSQNHAGCAVQTDKGKIYSGPYVENVAFNPSLSPLHTAVIQMTMENLESDYKITRAVLVEKFTSISQCSICEQLLRTIAPDVGLEYYEAE